ncbi:MAG: tRNA (N6-threonylcarbamoyladenosine(37)-N6)-methyltransferase TrmO [Oscillospiraceae bacterium]|nr:tRNA (N6-threonylcarbamoyladenosine(37)-N6)-methyltransferase TrmO [Oscillospiraceae bacterium]MBR5261153.1 tRNA (N6-threonylcarbamoyladenosine(37)-N6)-methyltransferase TrmO [Oscillospiraceae bacterium]
MEIKPIARIQSDFKTKFGIPRQPGLAPDLEALIVFEEEFRNPDALRGLEEFSHLWIIWEFSENIRAEFSPTVRPPRLGGDVRLGVFATRSPFRPNPIGLSCVKILGIEHSTEYGTFIRVSGADLMDSTPIYDIKPYVPYTDSHPDALNGFTSQSFHEVEVVCSGELLARIPESKRAGLLQALSQDPRPAYHNDPERIYGMDFSDYDVRFKVGGDTLTVTDIVKK